MCSISASKDKEVLLKLIELNRYRGEESHSVTTYLHQEDCEEGCDGFHLKTQLKQIKLCGNYYLITYVYNLIDHLMLISKIFQKNIIFSEIKQLVKTLKC